MLKRLFSQSQDHTPMTFNSAFLSPTLVAKPDSASAMAAWGGNTIPLRSGMRFDFKNITAARFKIDDVAYGLSHLVRFTGQARNGYSVAQHSVLASYLVTSEFAYDALMHDGHECLVGDCASPLKRLLPDYQALEHAVSDHFRAYFGCALRDASAVKHADMVMLVTEFRDVMAGIDLPPECVGIKPSSRRIHVWPRWYARRRFKQRFRELVGTRLTHEMACC